MAINDTAIDVVIITGDLRIIYETYYRTMISYLFGECRSYSSVYQPINIICQYKINYYEKLRQNLFNVNWDSLFLTDDIALITNDITNAILSAAECSIPSKIVTIRKGGPKWIGGILISDPFIPEICLTMFHQILQEEFMFVIFLIKSLLYLSFGVPRKLGLTFSY
jgi:hypothetical protein